MAAEHVARLGAQIARKREERGLTQKQLADRLPGNADGNQVSKWERGKHRPSDDTLEHIAAALDTTVFELLNPAPSEPADLREILGEQGTGYLVESRPGAVEAKLDAIIRHFGIDVEPPIPEGVPFGPAVAESRARQGSPSTSKPRAPKKTSSGR